MDERGILKLIGKDLCDSQLVRKTKLGQIRKEIQSLAVHISLGSNSEEMIELLTKMDKLNRKCLTLEIEVRVLAAIYDKIREFLK